MRKSPLTQRFACLHSVPHAELQCEEELQCATSFAYHQQNRKNPTKITKIPPTLVHTQAKQHSPMGWGAYAFARCACMQCIPVGTSWSKRSGVDCHTYPTRKLVIPEDEKLAPSKVGETMAQPRNRSINRALKNKVWTVFDDWWRQSQIVTSWTTIVSSKLHVVTCALCPVLFSIAERCQLQNPPVVCCNSSLFFIGHCRRTPCLMPRLLEIKKNTVHKKRQIPMSCAACSMEDVWKPLNCRGN